MLSCVILLICTRQVYVKSFKNVLFLFFAEIKIHTRLHPDLMGDKHAAFVGGECRFLFLIICRLHCLTLSLFLFNNFLFIDYSVSSLEMSFLQKLFFMLSFLFCYSIATLIQQIFANLDNILLYKMMKNYFCFNQFLPRAFNIFSGNYLVYM